MEPQSQIDYIVRRYYNADIGKLLAALHMSRGAFNNELKYDTFKIMYKVESTTSTIRRIPVPQLYDDYEYWNQGVKEWG